MDEKIGEGVPRIWPQAPNNVTALIHVLAVGRQYFMPCFVFVRVEVAVVSTCMLLMHSCVCLRLPT